MALVVALVVALVGCGSAGGETPQFKRAVQQADLDRIKDSAEAVRALPTGRYVAILSEQKSADTSARVLMTRRGQYDQASGLHQVEVTVPPLGGKPEYELTFLYGAPELLMKNAKFTERHGRTWTRLPTVPEALDGVGDLSPLAEPPGLDVLSTASAPGQVIKEQPDVTQYEVAVDMFKSIYLLGNRADERLGVSQDDVPADFTGTVDATVVLGEAGVRSLNVDLSAIFARASELAGKPADRVGVIRTTIQFQPGASVGLSLPAETDVGS